jgi:transcriptional regulator with XRE-family HTH domain
MTTLAAITMGLSPQAATNAERADMMATFGDRLRTAREAVGMAQGQLASAIGQNGPSWVSRIENGKGSLPDIVTVRKIAYAMGVSTDYLLGLDDDINADPVVLAAKSVADALDANRAADLAAYTEMLRKVSACRAVFDALTPAVAYLREAVVSVERRNADVLGDLVAWNRVPLAADRLESIVQQSKAVLPRMTSAGRAERHIRNQMGLFD